MGSVQRRRRLILVPIALAVLFAPTVSATITEQRSRLPPPAACGDVVEGVWKAHRWRRDLHTWRIFTLTIHRQPGSDSALIGTIRNEGWTGGPDRELPGGCAGLRYHWIVSTDARGTIHGQQVVFSGKDQWRLDRVVCHSGPGGYNLDSFSGLIDTDIEEFQSVNNDGGVDVNVPTVFRRVRCFPPGSRPHIDVAPPPFFPDRDPRGCL